MGVYLNIVTVTTTWLNWLGHLFTGKDQPVHSELYFQISGQWYITELTSDPCSPDEVVGKGDGYTVQLRKVRVPKGIYVEADTYDLERLVRLYASTAAGDLTSSAVERSFYDDPQRCGGPMYDSRYTSNTYVSWLLKRVCRVVPVRPPGAVGWGNEPLWPGPIRDCFLQ